jgi:hypothetical protein
MEGNLQECDRLRKEVERLRDKCAGLSISNAEYAKGHQNCVHRHELAAMKARAEKAESELTRLSGQTQSCPICESLAKKCEERDRVLANVDDLLIVADKYNANPHSFSACAEVGYYNEVKVVLASIRALRGEGKGDA